MQTKISPFPVTHTPPAVCGSIPTNVTDGAWPAGQCSNTAQGSTCTAICNFGLTGAPTSTCTSNGWTAVSGACQLLEVFSLGNYQYANLSAANAGCATVGARVATIQELQRAYYFGAHWCQWGHTNDSGVTAVAMVLQGAVVGCGGDGVSKDTTGWNGQNVSANCFGLRPAQGAAIPGNLSIRKFEHRSPGRWSMACDLNTRFNNANRTCGGYEATAPSTQPRNLSGCALYVLNYWCETRRHLELASPELAAYGTHGCVRHSRHDPPSFSTYACPARTYSIGMFNSSCIDCSANCSACNATGCTSCDANFRLNGTTCGEEPGCMCTF